MARRKRCVVKRRRKEEGKRRKREEKEENNWGPNRKKKKKEVRAHLFPLRSRHFLDQLEIGSLEKSTLYLLLFSCKIFFFDEQIM